MAMSNAAGNLEGMDDATAALLLQLQLEDIDEYIGNIREKGKSREGEVSDIELALQLEKEELQRNATILSDREMTKSIARAVVADAPVLGEAARGELDAAADRAIALRLAGGNPLQLPPAQGNHVDEPNDEFIDKLSALYVETPTEDPELSTALVRYDPGVNTGTGITKSTGALVIYNPDVDISNGESSAWAATRPVVNIEKRECVICLDMVVFFEIAKLPCGHECCRGCLQDMFTAAVVDESRYPPRCCDNIATDAKEVRLYLSAELIKAFEEKKVEWESTNRAYCSNEECGLFIRAEHVVPGLATCPTCHTVTCTFCKKSAHDGDCPDDEALQQTLRLMSETGWRRCQQCRAGVELTFGCNHITYVCTASPQSWMNLY